MPTRNAHSASTLDAMIAAVLGSTPRSTLAAIDGEELWDRVIDRAWRTRCGGFLAGRLAELGHALPDFAARQLRAYCEHVAADNAYKIERVAPVLSALNRERIPFLVLKGLALGTVLYESPALRPMTDVDILIRPEDVKRTHDVLVARCHCRPGEELVQDDFYPHFHYEREYLTSHVPSVKIDLHARPFRPLRYARTMPEDAMWDGGEVVAQTGGVPITIPSRENMLIHLCVHAACHGLESVRWLYDIKRWIERHENTLNWDAIVARCERWRLSHPMRRALDVTSATFRMKAAHLPEVIAALRHHRTAMDRIALWQAPHGQSRPVADVVVNAMCASGVAFRAAYLRAALLPSREHLGQIYPRRHWGWVATAHAYRVLRCVTRPFQSAEEAAA